MNEKFEENLSIAEDYRSMERETFGLWSPKRDQNQFFVVNPEKWTAIGPFRRAIAPRAYLQANSWVADGCELGIWGFGFHVMFKPTPLSFSRQDVTPVDVSSVFPALGRYRWNGATQGAPIEWTPKKLTPEKFEQLRRALQDLDLEWVREEIRCGRLTQPRNWHQEGSLVLTRSLDEGDCFCVVDEKPEVQ
jgi:hypothetical protein